MKSMLAVVCGLLLGTLIVKAEDRTNATVTVARNGNSASPMGSQVFIPRSDKAAQVSETADARDKIMGKRFVYSGPLVVLIKNKRPLSLFNPFSEANSTPGKLDNVRLDPYLAQPRGISLFRIEF